MRIRFSVLMGFMVGGIILLTLALIFHWGGDEGLSSVERLTLPSCVLFGGLLTLFAAHLYPRATENVEIWSRRGRLSSASAGIGLVLWAIGAFYFLYLQASGQMSVFSWNHLSLANLCFVITHLLILLGLFFVPPQILGSRHVLVLIDSFISTGSLFAISWFLLLGPLTLTPGRNLASRLINTYVPTMSVLILCYVLYLLLNTFAFADDPSHPVSDAQKAISTVQRIGLLVASLGIIIFELVTFTIHIEENLGTYKGSAAWTDLGWAAGAMMIGLAACLRRFLPATTEVENKSYRSRINRLTPRIRLEAIQFLPYLLGLFSMLVLIINVFSSQPDQEAIRPVLTIVTLAVISLVLVRQIITVVENERLIKKQTVTLEQLEQTSCELTRHMALQAELCVAAKIQAQLLPQHVPQVAGLDIFAHSHPAKQVGGDFYDVFARPDAPFVFALGDISGHGLPAALLMTMTRTVFHTATRSLSIIDPQTILKRTNEDLYEDFTEVGMFVTVFVGCYDAHLAQLMYANAGHSPVIYCPRGGTATLLEADAPVLGVLPTNTCTNHLLPFHEGDVLLVGTDGLNESFNTQGEMFGYERLLKTVETLAPLPAHELGCELLKAIEQFTQGYQQSDDQTFIVLKGIAA